MNALMVSGWVKKVLHQGEKECRFVMSVYRPESAVQEGESRFFSLPVTMRGGWLDLEVGQYISVFGKLDAPANGRRAGIYCDYRNVAFRMSFNGLPVGYPTPPREVLELF